MFERFKQRRWIKKENPLQSKLADVTEEELTIAQMQLTARMNMFPKNRLVVDDLIEFNRTLKWLFTDDNLDEVFRRESITTFDVDAVFRKMGSLH